MIAHAVAAFGEDRLPLSQAFATEVLHEVRFPRGADPAFLDDCQPVVVHRRTASTIAPIATAIPTTMQAYNMGTIIVVPPPADSGEQGDAGGGTNWPHPGTG
jgi:hypothetical protein